MGQTVLEMSLIEFNHHKYVATEINGILLKKKKKTFVGLANMEKDVV